MSKQMTGPYLEAVVALHNLAIALEQSQELGRATDGFPVYALPTDFISVRLVALANELCRPVEIARAKLEGRS